MHYSTKVKYREREEGKGISPDPKRRTRNQQRRRGARRTTAVLQACGGARLGGCSLRGEEKKHGRQMRLKVGGGSGAIYGAEHLGVTASRIVEALDFGTGAEWSLALLQ